MSVSIWIDADSCPTLVRNYVVLHGNNYGAKVYFVANKQITASSNNFTMITCETKKDAADNYIFENTKENDIVITRDILLAQRLVQKEITTLNDKGFSFTKSNIKEKLSQRDFDIQITNIVFSGQNKSSYSQRQLEKFKHCFDRELKSKIIKDSFQPHL